MFLHYPWHYTKLVRDIDLLKQRLNDTWDCIPQGIIDEAIDYTVDTAACMCKGKWKSLQTPTLF